MTVIDHAAEARKLIGANGSDWRNGVVAVAQLTEAQVHATLALVEQQRIANLIAYVGLLDGQYAAAAADPEPWDWTSYEASSARRERASELIREGLGLA